MSIDYHALASGVATRFAPANITPPTGYTDVRGSTAQPPNNIPATPWVNVFPREGEVIYLPGQRKGEHQLTVSFYYDKASGDQARDWTGLEKWLSVLLDQLHSTSKLGLAPVVDKALVESYEFVVLTYGGDEYQGINLNVRVWTTDSVSLTP